MCIFASKNSYLGIRMTWINDKTGLVLEGGGLRGVFTCGVLDCFLDHDIHFPYVIGVSAGACNGLSYMSGQRGRAKRSNIDMLEKYHYIGLRPMFKKHCFIDMDLLFNDFPDRLLPYDYDSYWKNPARFEMVTTNCITGKACYLHEDKDGKKLTKIARASSSLPYVSQVVFINHQPMLDGGIVDSIPLERAMSQGLEKNVVILTRNKGYRKPEKHHNLPRMVYSRFPKLREALMNRSSCYNEQLELVERLESEGKVLVVRPERPIVVSRLENDTQKLTDLYQEGYDIAEKMLPVLLSQ